ncbi:MAG: helix-turn-helix domain-containing protein [Firmicutes bacterium]|nr:helix-turn-helix domain-containing protein [Bacillota bacterium]
MFLQRLNNLISEKGITRNKLLLDLQLGKKSFVNWEQRSTIPSGETLLKIANYFGVSVDYLLGRDKTFADLSKREQFLKVCYAVVE